MSENASADTGLALAIAAAERDGKQTIPLDGTFNVILTNRSGRELKIWEDSNSWGYAALRFEVTKPDGHKMTVKKAERSWRKNVPTFWTVGDGKTLTYKVSFSSGEWEGIPKDLAGQPVKMRAVIEIPADAETKEFGVWSGRVVSPPTEVVLR